MAYSKFRVRESDIWATAARPLVDANGAILYENDYRALLLRIIELNDVATLNRYLEIHPSVLGPGDSDSLDPFYVAAAHGSIDALRVLLDHYYADPTQAQAFDQRGFQLLNLTCRHAHLKMARFLLDSQPPLGTVHARDRYGATALLSAAASLAYLSSDEEEENNDSYDNWVRGRIAHGEELMHFLLDRGASARDAIIIRRADGGQSPQQPLYTVLGRAISWASYKLATRLIAEGADVHAREQYPHNGFGGAGFGAAEDVAHDVTVLHLASFYWNPEGIRALLDHRGSDIDISDMVSMRDSTGRLPLHWAAAGGGVHSEDPLLSEDNIGSRIVDTFKLLVAGNPSTINIQDKQGATALYYAVGSHAGCGGRHSELVIRFLSENGADPRLQHSNGKTVLHMLAFYSIEGGPINPAVLDLLVTHGANVGQADMDGNTALHIMARNLRQVKAARFLISQGADVSAKNAKGNTPIHEAMRGVLQPRYSREKIEDVTLAGRIKAQDEMIAVLQEARGYNKILMDQPNAAGKTPQQLLDERRTEWRRSEERA